MCDEYDDERMRILWRALAEKETLLEGQEESGVKQERLPELSLAGPDVLPKPKARPLSR